MVHLDLALLQRDLLDLDRNGDFHLVVHYVVLLVEVLPAPVVTLKLGHRYEEYVVLVDVVLVLDVVHGPDRALERGERTSLVRRQPDL